MKAIPAMPPGHCLGALEMLQKKLNNVLIGCPLSRENALVPLPFQKRSIQACWALLAYTDSADIRRLYSKWRMVIVSKDLGDEQSHDIGPCSLFKGCVYLW